MTSTLAENQAQESRPSDKELNFRKLEAKYQQEVAVERAKREDAERRAQELTEKRSPEEEDTSEPYVDHKKLEKKLAKFGEQTQKQTQSEIQKAVHVALQEERKNTWIQNNPDFYETLENHVDKLALKAPKLADSILAMPESFERQKLVYQNIKALGLDKAPVAEPSIQDKIEANRRTPYYQPSGVGTSPYASVGDFSASGQKQAYDKMKELQSRLRI